MHTLPVRRSAFLLTLVLTMAVGVFGTPSPAAITLAQTASNPVLLYATYPDSKNADSQGLYSVRTDGSHKRQLVKAKGIISMAASPNGEYVAYYAYDAETQVATPITDMALYLLTVADESVKRITALTTPATEMKEAGDGRLWTALFPDGDRLSLEWSPDGQQLAFIGAQGKSNSADLFLYMLKTDTVTQLSSGGSQATAPSWSPDGKYILHFAVDSFGSGAGDKLGDVWLARADNSGITRLYKPTGGDEGALGWINPTTFLVWSWDVQCGYHNIRAYNVETRQETMWLGEYYQDAAYDPIDDVLLFTLTDSMGSCQLGLNSGLYRMTSVNLTPNIISSTAPNVLKWSAQARTFFGFLATSPNGYEIVTISPEGVVSEATKNPNIIPQVSRDNKYWAWIQDPQNTLSVAIPGLPTSLKIAPNVSHVIWLS